MEKIVMYFAVGDAAIAYEQDGFDAMIEEIEDYNGSVERIEFNSEQERKAFCDGLEFAEDNCCKFWFIDDDDVKAHKDIVDRLA